MDVKSSPVHFFVQRNITYGRENSVVPFELERLNVGEAMDINTGTFVAPQSGTYFFSFAFMKDEQAKNVTIYIRKNCVNIGAAHTHALPNTKIQSSLQATLKLKSGDSVDLFQMQNGNIYDDASHYTHFTGWLIEEDIEEKAIPEPISTVQIADPLCNVNGFPKSCQDLRCRGHTADGFYLVRSVIGVNKINTVYCEFGDSTTSEGSR